MLAPRLLKRRADAVHPYPSIPVRDLTSAQADEVQLVLCDQYWGAKERAEWDTIFWRGGQPPHAPRVRVGVLRELHAIRRNKARPKGIRLPGMIKRRQVGSQRGAPGKKGRR